MSNLMFDIGLGHLLVFGWLISSKKPIQLFPRLTRRRLWCISSDLVVYPVGRGKDVIQSVLNKSPFVGFITNSTE